MPVYTRVPYSNTTMDGEDYGTKLVLAQEEVEDGPCWVVEMENMMEYFQEEEISRRELKDFVFHSNLFFVDRLSLLEEEKGSFFKKVMSKKQVKRDILLKEQLNQYFDCKKQKKVYQK